MRTPLRAWRCGWLLTIVAVCLAGRGTAAQPTPRVQQSAPPYQQSSTPPSWVLRGQADDAQNRFFIGTASSASESQAMENARADAVRKAVVTIASNLFADPGTPTSYGTSALSDYVRKVGRRAGDYTKAAAGRSAGYEAFALLQLSTGFIEPSTVQKYVSSLTAGTADQTGGAAIGYLLIPPWVESLVTKRTQVRMPSLRSGNFFMSFIIAGAKDRIWIRLDPIQVLEDGSGGSARWTFDVFVDGRKAFNVPLTAYSNDVITYRMRAGDKSVETQAVAGDSVIEVKIVGTRGGAAASAR